MAETPETQQQQESSAESLSSKMEKMNISSSPFTIWPPTDRTRTAVVNRLVETLSTPSVLSKRYGILPPDEASDVAKSIEEQAFSSASTGDATVSIDQGIEILQAYSKEISKRVLDIAKSRADSAAVEPNEDAPAAHLTRGQAEEVGSTHAVAVNQEFDSATAANSDI